MVTFCVLIYSLVILSFSEIDATKHSFYYYILSLGDSELLVAFPSSKSPLDFFLISGVTGSLRAWSSSYSLILLLHIGTTKFWQVFHLLTFSINFIKLCIEIRFTCTTLFFSLLVIKIKPARESCILPLELISIGIIFSILLPKSFQRIVTTGSSISYKFPPLFSTHSLGATFSLDDTDFFGDVPMVLDDMMILWLIFQQTY